MGMLGQNLLFALACADTSRLATPYLTLDSQRTSELAREIHRLAPLRLAAKCSIPTEPPDFSAGESAEPALDPARNHAPRRRPGSVQGKEDCVLASVR